MSTTTFNTGTSFLGLLSPSTLPGTLRANPQHLIPLLASVTLGFGGLVALNNPRKAIQAFGLPDYIADSHPAQVGFTVNGSAIIALGAAIGIFYSRAKFAEVDTLVSLVGFTGAVGGLVCFREGKDKEAVAKWVAAVVATLWGWNRCTQNGVF